MREVKKRYHAVLIVLAIYFVCLIFRLFEYFVLRTDRTWIGEAIIHKLIGIAVLFIVAKSLQMSAENIGFAKGRSWVNVFKGIAFGIGVFMIAYAVEIAIAISNGKFDSLQVYVSSYAVDQNIGYRTNAFFFLICMIGNIINVIMEEGVFRGLFVKILERKYSYMISAGIASVLFGLWHVVGPIRSFLDGTSGVEGMLANAWMLVISSGLVGFKFALLTKMTGNLYLPMGDHFVNNTIVNILHVVSHTGADEMMFVRITIAQSVSFFIVLICYICREKRTR